MVQHGNNRAAAGTGLPRAPATGKGLRGRLQFSRWPAFPTQTKAVRWMVGLFVVGCAAPSGGFGQDGGMGARESKGPGVAPRLKGTISYTVRYELIMNLL